jgi:hypothetical protein
VTANFRRQIHYARRTGGGTNDTQTRLAAQVHTEISFSVLLPEAGKGAISPSICSLYPDRREEVVSDCGSCIQGQVIQPIIKSRICARHLMLS